MSEGLFDVVGRSGNLATAVGREAADRLAEVSGATVRPHVTVTVTEFTMDLRLCDDAGMVADEYMGLLNRLRWLSGHEPYEGDPFPCTGSAHLAGGHIRCTSPAHEIADEWTPGSALLGGGGEPEEALGGDLGRGNPTRSVRGPHSSAITFCTDPGDECGCGSCA